MELLHQGLDLGPHDTCATRTGAEIMGRADAFGTVQAGKLADLVVVDGDVLGDIAVLEDRGRFLAVMQGGAIKAGQLAPAETDPDPRRGVKACARPRDIP